MGRAGSRRTSDAAGRHRRLARHGRSRFLVQRMREERTSTISSRYFSRIAGRSESAGIGRDAAPVANATNVCRARVGSRDRVCQGGDYTKEIYRTAQNAWKGYWIDAASALRSEDDAVIILDPVNGRSSRIPWHRAERLLGGNARWLC